MSLTIIEDSVPIKDKNQYFLYKNKPRNGLMEQHQIEHIKLDITTFIKYTLYLRLNQKKELKGVEN